MIKQLIINGKKSYDDFNVYIGTREITSPKKKSVKASVPFSNTVYDFSKMNGELYWNERTLKYSFDIAELSTEEMENVKSELLNWLLNVHDTDIYDPYIGDYHFHGSYDADSWTENFGAGTITVTFSVYPYKISNENVEVKVELNNEEQTIVINNNSAHRVSPTIVSDGNFTISYGDNSYAIGKGTFVSGFYFECGTNEIKINGTGNITFSYIEEVF